MRRAWTEMANGCAISTGTGLFPGAVGGKQRFVLLHHPMQVSLAQAQAALQAFSSHTTQKPLADRVCCWRFIRCILCPKNRRILCDRSPAMTAIAPPSLYP